MKKLCNMYASFWKQENLFFDLLMQVLFYLPTCVLVGFVIGEYLK